MDFRIMQVQLTLEQQGFELQGPLVSRFFTVVNTTVLNLRLIEPIDVKP